MYQLVFRQNINNYKSHGNYHIMYNILQFNISIKSRSIDGLSLGRQLSSIN
jgi:hypothetical protein